MTEERVHRLDAEALELFARKGTKGGPDVPQAGSKNGVKVRRDVEKIGPSLVIHDTFAVIGRVIAMILGIPRVNFCAGHNVAPAAYLAALEKDPRVKISPLCLQAVGTLRESYGLADASPFSYVSSLSPHLNIYCEPPEFLDEEKRLPFEPVAFYGSLPSLKEVKNGQRKKSTDFGSASSRKFKVFVSFGTIVWRYYAAEGLRALTTLAAAFAERDNVRAVISLGDAEIGRQDLAALDRPNVSVKSRVDQWRILQETDAFLTHHGMNSTHEAIFHRVPMISYPFFWDQPELAEICQKLGLAIPLTGTLRGAFSRDQVHLAVTRLAGQRESMREALSRAREWEQAVIDNRPAVHRRIAELLE